MKGQDTAGKAFQGYVWGGHIAKGWRKADLTGDGNAEFVLLGVSSKPRKKLTDIQGELRILQKGRVLHRSNVPGLCLFEDCGSSALLRILNVPSANNALVIEASVMTIGCWAGIEKTYFYWNGAELELIYHAELISGKVLANHPFSVKDKNGAEVMTCRYVREGDDYNPLWDCRGVKAKPVAAQAVVVRAKWIRCISWLYNFPLQYCNSDAHEKVPLWNFTFVKLGYAIKQRNKKKRTLVAKIGRGFVILFSSILLLILIVLLLIQTAPVQNFARKKIVSFLEQKLDTKVAIGGLDITFPKMLVLEGSLYRRPNSGYVAGRSPVEGGH
ncbi:MAG: hypothetical protein IPO07_27305 [Haliscomenobacter sp.]|nr:hypothetical protein [Haliscomenobacter sp.]MBK9492096.1 hypothetical protein [Haliscomenobacter sp.]